MKLRPEEIEPKPEDPFAGDLLKREQYAKVLTQIVQNTEGGFTLSINADWGYGKTTFVKMWEKVLQNAGYQTIYFNAWESDFVADPMMALVDGLRDGFDGKNFSAETIQTLSAILDVAIDLIQLLPTPYAKIIGKGTKAAKKGVCNLLKDKNPLQRQQSYSKLVAEFREQLAHFAKEMCGNKQLIIFVDELDRCRPDYAVQMLERIKHFFSAENIVFVLSIDKSVILESIKSIYGDIKPEGYLRRFIDLEFDLPEPDIKDFIDAKFKEHNIDERFDKYSNALVSFEKQKWELEKTIKDCFAAHQHSLRDVEKYFNCLDIVIRSLGVKNMVPELVVFILYLHMFDKKFYEKYKLLKFDIDELWDIFENKLEASPFQPESDEYKELGMIWMMVWACYVTQWRDHQHSKEYEDLWQKLNQGETNKPFLQKHSKVALIYLNKTEYYNVEGLYKIIEMVETHFDVPAIESSLDK